MKITDLYFGYMQYSFNTGKLTEHNLFNSYRILHSVAKWVTMSKKDKELMGTDLIHYCFFDSCGRCEYEFVVSPWIGDGEIKKVDTWTMYVLPNKKILADLVNSVSKHSATMWLREQKRRYKRSV